MGEPFSDSQKEGHAESSEYPAKGLLSCYLLSAILEVCWVLSPLAW